MASLFGALSAGLGGSLIVASSAAFAWGLASLVLSPCHLASIPLLVAFINGQPGASTRRAAALATLFAMGIFAAILIVGFATAAAGRLLGDVGPWATYVVAAVFLLAGLSLLDVVPASWATPMVPALAGRGASGALVLGAVFGLALGPCTFAYLAPVLAVAFAAGAHGVPGGLVLVTAFAVGHCALMVAAGASAGRLRQVLAARADGVRLQMWRRGSGILVFAGGLYLLYAA